MKRKLVFVDMNPAIVEIPIYQIGLCYLGGIALTKGWEINIIEFHDLQCRGIFSYINVLDSADCIGVSIRNIDNTEGSNPISYINKIKEYMQFFSERYSTKTILGGAGFSILPYEILDLFNLKYGILGRGGEKWDHLLDWIDSGGNIADFFTQKVIYSNAECDIYKYEKLKYIWDVIPYIKNTDKVLGFDTHIGCGGHCIYCTYPKIAQQKGFKRSIQEIKLFIESAEKAGVHKLQIVDDIFNSDLLYAKEVCSVIKQVKHHINISCYLSPNVDIELAYLLFEAGIHEVVMGIDSLSNEVLCKMNKGFTEEQAYSARQLLGQAGISVIYTFIMGGPYETKETLEETKKNIIKHAPNKVTLQYGIRIYPGTPLFSQFGVDETEIWRPRFLMSENVSKREVIDTIQEIKQMVGERKML